MGPISRQVNITTQFIAAVKALKARGITTTELCRKTGIDKCNLYRLLREPERLYPRPQWLTSICIHYGVSPAFLIMGEGDVFVR